MKTTAPGNAGKPGKKTGKAPSGDANTRKDTVEVIANADKTMEKLRRIESEQKKDQRALEEITHALRERVKELNCLYSISHIVETYGLDLDMILERSAEIIPIAWQYPEVTCCRIRLEGTLVQSPDFEETPWKLSQNIMVDDKALGFVEVFYRVEKPDMDEGPFLAEERSLLRVIAERFGKLVDRKRAEDALHQSELKNIALLNAIPDLMFQVDDKGILVGLRSGDFILLRDLEESLVGRSIYCLADQEALLPRRLIDQAMTSVRRALETGNPQVFEQHTSLNSKGRDYEIRMVVCRPNEVLGIVRDITRRKRLEREILEISNREQRRIGQDLHDSLCQHLAGIGFMGKVLEKKISSKAPVDTGDVREIVDLIDQAITLTKGYARGLNPIQLEAEGLMIALGKLAENVQKLFGVTCTFTCTAPIYILDNEMSANLYRIVQEALNNAIKHGKAREVSITLEKTGSTVHLSVCDNGVGIGKTRRTGKGMGLNIMRYRASMFGASLDIKSPAKGGTEITCSFQLL